MFIKLIGKASNKVKLLDINQRELDMSLLEFLVSKEIPIASSCSGRQSCRKCVFNEGLFSCSYTLRELLNSNNEKTKEIRIDYL